MGYSNGQLESEVKGGKGEKWDSGLPGIGFKLTDDGNFDIDERRLTDVVDSIDDGNAVNLKVLKEHTQFSQNNYHLQPIYNPILYPRKYEMASCKSLSILKHHKQNGY